MQRFEWHLMAVEEPPEGVGEYLLRGHDGNLNVAHRYEYARFTGKKEFVRLGHEYEFIYADLVHAWAEIPPLEEYETERVMCVGKCTECDHYYLNNSFCNPSWCDWWGDETEDDGFCHCFEPRSDG